MIGKYIVLTLLASILMLTGCQNAQQPPGTVEGTVTVGPIFPVERPGETRPVPPQVFENRKVIVYNKTGKRIIEIIDLEQVGQTAEATYCVQLPPGQYIVDITHGGIDRSADVPKNIEILSSQTIVINIDIDTGIR